MALKPGTKGNLSGSMAEAIEKAFRAEWPKVMEGSDLPAETSPDMQLLFTAIAQGVVKHLKENADAFQVSVSVSGAHTGQHSASATVTIK
jgi:hypothetical protein